MQDEKIGLGLRASLLLWVLPCVTVGMGGIWLLATTTARQQVVRLEAASGELSARNLAESVVRALTNATADLITTARLDLAAEAIDSGDAKNFAWYANAMVRSKGKYSALIVIDDEGTVVAGNTADRNGGLLKAGFAGRDASKETWFSELETLKQDTLHQISLGRPALFEGVLSPDARAIGFAVPVFDIMDERIGTVIAFVAEDYLRKIVDGYTTQHDGVIDSMANIVDAQGRVVIGPQGEAADIASDRSGFEAQSASIGNGKFFGWRATVLQSVEMLEAPVTAVSQRILVGFVLSLLITAALIVAVATRLVAPIRRLTDAAAGRGGRALATVEVTSSDEVGVLTRAFNKMVASISEYQTELESKVEERTRALKASQKEMEDILGSILQGIFTVSRDLRVNSGYSKHTEAVLGTVDLAGRDVLELLQLDEQEDDRAKAVMSMFLRMTMGGDEMQWMLAEGSRVEQVTYRRSSAKGEETRVLKLEYAPVYENGIVEKVMILASDLTEIIRLEQEIAQKNSENERAMQLAAQIAQMDGDLFNTFISEAYGLLDVCRESAIRLANGDRSDNVVNAIFRAMHTLKGNARIFGLQTIQRIAHEFEDYFVQIRDNKVILTDEAIEDVSARLEHVQMGVEEFEAFGRRFHKEEDGASGSVGESVRIADAQLVGLRTAERHLTRVVRDHEVSPTVQSACADVHRAVEALQMKSAREVFEPLRKMVFDLSKELERPVEDLKIGGPKLLFAPQAASKVRDAIVHAIRNALDHGLEPPEDRLASGKPARGQMEIAFDACSEGIVVRLIDDGRGVDPQKVKMSAVGKGLIDAEAADGLSKEDVLALLFEPGFSTAAKVTEVSGRGVGMDAIATSLRELHGRASLESELGRGTTLRLELPRTLDGQDLVMVDPSIAGMTESIDLRRQLD